MKSPVGNRIVQRSILQVLQKEKKAKALFLNKWSFGGAEGKNVGSAVALAYEEMIKGKIWYIRSDITDFFTKVPKATVLDKIKEKIDDEEFHQILAEAVHTEPENLDKLYKRPICFHCMKLGSFKAVACHRFCECAPI